jgi:tetratricopeptide (TPR) repeat protein
MTASAVVAWAWWRRLAIAVAAAAFTAAAVRGGSYDIVARAEAFLLVWWLLCLGLALGLRGWAPAGAAGIAIAALLALAAWMAVGLIWTESDQRTVGEVTRVVGLTGVLVLATTQAGPRDWRFAVGGLTVTTVLVCALALASRLAPELVPSDLSVSGFERRRLSHPFDYWNALGAWAAISVALTLAWSASAARWWSRGAALAGTCLAASVDYLTYSRSAALGVVVAVAAVVALSPRRWLALTHTLVAALGTAAVVVAIRSRPQLAAGTGDDGAGLVLLVLVLVSLLSFAAARGVAAAGIERLRLPRRAGRLLLLAVAGVVLAAAAAAGPDAADRAWKSFSSGENPQPSDPARRLTTLSGGRQHLWSVALDAFADDPLRGMGAGTFEFASNRDPERREYVRDAHSLYLESLAELGVPGAILVVLALGTLLVAAGRAALRERAPPAAGAAAGCAAALASYSVTAGVDWLWEMTAVTIAALVAGGLATAAGGGKARPAGRPSRRMRIVGSIAALGFLVVQLPGLVAANRLRDSQAAVRAGQPAAALAAATDAITAEPWGASGYLQRALVLERLEALPEAAADARRAVRREPTNWQTWLVLARIEAERRDVPAALRAARRAHRLNPTSPVFPPER